MSRNTRKRNFKHIVELEVCGEYVAGKGIRLTPGKVKSGKGEVGRQRPEGLFENCLDVM